MPSDMEVYDGLPLTLRLLVSEYGFDKLRDLLRDFYELDIGNTDEMRNISSETLIRIENLLIKDRQIWQRKQIKENQNLGQKLKKQMVKKL